MFPVTVRSRRIARANLEKRCPGAAVVDVTSRAPEPWVRFSPFFPHGGIPVPFSGGRTAVSVEGIWQALKVFESSGVDVSKLENATMKNLKRTVRKHGRCAGHQRGLEGTELLGYLEARRAIYLPTYAWVLEHRLGPELEALRQLAARAPLVLLDYETNGDVENLSKPLSHAALIAQALM